MAGTSESAPPRPSTHPAIEPSLSGRPTAMGEGWARVRLDTSEAMRADERGLVHGGFVFSLADYAAMLAIDHPNVVLGSAEVRFLRPVVVGDRVDAEARLEAVEGKKHRVAVAVRKASDEEGDGPGEVVFEGRFTCFVPERHVLAG
ncbi:MAG: PaaI family thioesterase [Holophagales bacterium]|nr:PaaI family thioesterase [Holophagales bacterium]